MLLRWGRPAINEQEWWYGLRHRWWRVVAVADVVVVVVVVVLWARGEDWTQRWGLWKKKKQQQKDSFAASRVRSKCRSLGVSEMEKVVVMSGEKDPEEKRCRVPYATTCSAQISHGALTPFTTFLSNDGVNIFMSNTTNLVTKVQAPLFVGCSIQPP